MAVLLAAKDLKRTALTRPQAAALRAINKIDLKEVRARAIVHERWSPQQADRAEKWYRGYLWLVYLHNRPVYGLVGESDEIWHAHVVYTKKYRTDCRRVFGRYLDHTPFDHPRLRRINKQMKQNIEQSLRWYDSEFTQPFVVAAEFAAAIKPASSRRSTLAGGLKPIPLVFHCF